MIHGAGRILGWKPAASAFLQVAGFLWALGLSQNPTGMVLYGPPPQPPTPLQNQTGTVSYGTPSSPLPHPRHHKLSLGS